MEYKKSSKADLENKKSLFFEIGLIIALVFTLVAFEWKSSEKKEASLDAGPALIIEEESVPITTEAPPPPQEVPTAPVVVETFTLGDNDMKLDLDLNFNTEDDKKGVEAMDYVEKKEIKEEEEVKEEVIPFAIVEDKPSFMGGDANLFPAWVNKNMKYPEAAAENGIQGTVYIAFVVGTDGKLTNIKVLRPVDPLLDQEALRVVRSSPSWKPGKQRNKAVPVSYQFPVRFVLQ